MARVGHLTSIVVDCSYPPGAARFWGRALGAEVVDPGGENGPDESTVVVPDGTRLVFRRRERFVEKLPEASAETEPGRTSRVDLSGMLRLASDPRPGRVEAPVRGLGLRLAVHDVEAATDQVLRWGAVGPSDEAGSTGTFRDPAGVRFTLETDESAPPVLPEPMTDVHRYVAIGDSTTEGLVDGDGQGGWRGWADRFAAQIAGASEHPVEYANLAVSGYRLSEIAGQLEPALAMEPDLMTIVGGVNDILGLRPHFAAMEEELDALFAAPRERGIPVLSFTMPDISRANPVATVVRDRLQTLNQITRRCALRHDVALVDFERIASASDPRLWGEDRLHINTIGHIRVAAAMAWLINVPGSDRTWAEDLDELQVPPGQAEDDGEPGPSEIGPFLQWGLHHFGPWVLKGIRGAQYRHGAECKRPDPRVIELQQDPRAM